ncbi:MAG: hypothetical protein PHG47_01125 [Sulfuricella sp.]|nr:hypothetical protein [Sulfuricella sp.]
MRFRRMALYGVLGVVFAGCASAPIGPSTAVMPGAGKPFDLFRMDNAECMAFARQQTGANSGEVAREQIVTGAVAGVALGAASGALIGHGHERTTESMAGAGLIVGSAAGANAANMSTASLQRRYDLAYQQCMYAKGNQIPGYASPRYVPPPSYSPPPPPPRP